MPKSSDPQHPVVLEMLSALNESQCELYEERSAILEWETGLDRSYAEAVALLEVIRRIGWPPKRTE